MHWHGSNLSHVKRFSVVIGEIVGALRSHAFIPHKLSCEQKLLHFFYFTTTPPPHCHCQTLRNVTSQNTKLSDLSVRKPFWGSLVQKYKTSRVSDTLSFTIAFVRGFVSPNVESNLLVQIRKEKLLRSESKSMSYNVIRI